MYYHLTKKNKACKNYNIIIIIKFVRIITLSDAHTCQEKKFSQLVGAVFQHSKIFP